jgi:hypothetical protein
MKFCEISYPRYILQCFIPKQKYHDVKSRTFFNQRSQILYQKRSYEYTVNLLKLPVFNYCTVEGFRTMAP